MSQPTAPKDKPKFYLTTPIYYANSRPHVGSAYTTIVCDVIARYKRMCGFDVAYLTGTDEHGVNIERAAEAKGITPQRLVDQNEAIFRDLWKLLGITNTDFIRTTSAEHARAVETLVRRTMERDEKLPPEKRSIYKAKYEGRYCIYDNLYVSDTPEPANCPTCGRPAELISEENYFFRLSAYRERLLELYRENHADAYSREFIQPHFRMKEVRTFVESGLKDVSISRKTIKWGIPWPGDPEHVFYVWYDALTSYMSGIGYASDQKEEEKRFERFWPADLHMIGKEIIRFHAVYWPAFLMAAELPLPKQIFAHGWLLFEQEKMSKSKGNVAYPEPIVRAFDELTGAKVGNDALRYYLLTETIFGQDGNFSREALITRYEADLVNGLGNLVSRTLAMIERYFGGVVPRPSNEQLPAVLGGMNTTWQWWANETRAGFVQFADYLNISQAISFIPQFVAAIDAYIAEQKPWKIAEDPSQRQQLADVLYAAVEGVRMVTVLAHPVIPESTAIIWKHLGQLGSPSDVMVKELAWGGMKPGTRIEKPGSIFPRVDKKEVSERIEAMEDEIRNPGKPTPPATPPPGPTGASSTPPTAAGGAVPPAGVPASTKITIDDFAKVELRVGQIKSAERIQGADKLLKLMVDIGDEVRQVLAGIALGYTPEELVGRKVVVVTNLAPRKMRGLESNGMLLAASAGADGKPVLCTFAEDIPVGSKVK
jgi:methionyl-tRNA synthetase